MNKNLLRAYVSDASRIKGKVDDVFFPENVSDVRKMVLGTNRIVVRGAGTGLAGGAVPQGDVVLDLSKLNRIGEFDNERKTIEVDAGVVLDDLQDYVSKYGLEFPVKPSSHSVCTIGGMIATNAVGNRGVKYGKTSNWVKWVEVVDGRGRIEKKGITEMSDYVGMEGITGVVVRICLKLSLKKRRIGKVVGFDNLKDLVEAVRELKRDVSISMIEFLDKVVSKGVGFGDKYHLVLEKEIEEFNNIEEGWVDGEEYEKLMNMRDRVYPYVAGEGYTRIEDPKLMVDRFDVLMKWLEERGIPVFGHVGVGIFHPCFNVDQEKSIPEMMKIVKRLGGQVSGEHGIGLLKRGFVEINDQKILRNVKKRCDPDGKFGNGKVV